MACGGFLERSEPPEIFIAAPEEKAELGEEERRPGKSETVTHWRLVCVTADGGPSVEPTVPD